MMQMYIQGAAKNEPTPKMVGLTPENFCAKFCTLV